MKQAVGTIKSYIRSLLKSSMSQENLGWVKLYRRIEEWDGYFVEPFDRTHAWIDLFLYANHKESSFFVRGLEVKVNRGQIAWSEERMASRWMWSRNKVRRFLKWLKTKQQIEQQKTCNITVITILNYDELQSNDTTNDTTERQQTIQQKDTYKNVKNEKNVKKDICSTSTEVSETVRSFERFWDIYPRKVSKKKAAQVWGRLSLNETEVQKVIASVAFMSSSEQWRKDAGAFIPHPATYLNQERWNDEREVKVAPLEVKKTLVQLKREAAQACHVCLGVGMVDIGDNTRAVCGCQDIAVV